MRNLKRVLTLVMAVAMMMSLLVVGAGAAFPDQDKIKNTEAVNMNVALGIIKGRDTGVFDPTGNVTRAEMAKMITIALNGGKEPTLGTKATASYTDTKGHWAEAYIEYCTTLGIVAGMGDGTFAPNASVTGTQAAKMLLVCLGYDAVKENFNGANWSININVRASQKSLYADLTIDPNAPLNRDDAAQVVYNALDAVKVEYEYKLTTVNGALTTTAVLKDMTGANNTILKDKFKMETVKGVLTGVAYNSDTKKYTYTYSDVASGTISAVASADYVDLAATKDDYTNFYGQYVKILYKAGTSENTIYGMYDEGGLTVKATIGQLDSVTGDNKKVEVAGTEYRLAATYTTVKGYVFDYPDTDPTTAGVANFIANFDAASDVILVSHDSNTTIDYAVVLPKTVAKVTNVTPTGVNAGTSYTYEDDNIVSGLKKNDFVVIVADANAFKNENTLTKADVISGKITGNKNSTDIKVDGTWYKRAANPGDNIALGETFDVVVVGNHYYNLKKTSDGGASISNLIYISAAEDATTINKVKAKAYFTDGTNAIINISKYSATGTANLTDTNQDNWKTDSDNVLAGNLYTYSKDSDGYYRITMVNNANLADMDAYNATAGNFTKSSSSADAKIGTNNIADDAVIFVKDADGTKVFTGAQVNKFTGNITNSTSIVLTDKVNGLSVVTAGLMITSGKAATGLTDNYGYVVSTPYSVKDGDDTYRTYDLWNGTKTMTVIDKSSGINPVKGSIITYTDLGDGYIEADSKVASKGAVVGFSSKTLLVDFDLTVATTADRATYILDEDTQYLYIDTKSNKGISTGSISVADKNVAETLYISNVYVIAGTAGTADLVVVEVNNKMDASAVDSIYSVATPSITAEAGYSISANKVFAEQGDTVTVTVTATAAAASKTLTITATGAASVTPATETHTTGTAGTYTFTVTMDDANVTALSVALS